MQTQFKSTYQTIIKASPDKVWDALTNPDMVKQYFFGTNLVTDWNVGSPIFFRGEWEGQPYQDRGIVQEFIPHKSLAYSYFSNWSGMPETPDNYLQVTYTLTKVSDGTQLTITQSNYDEERAKHSEANWAMVIDGLKKLIE